MISALICVSSFLVVSMFVKNSSEKSFHYSAGICERTEAFIFFIWMILFKKTYFIAAYSFASLMLITAFIRVIEFVKKNNQIGSLLPSNKKSE